MQKISKKRKVMITTERPSSRIMLYGEISSQIGEVLCESNRVQNNMSLHSMLMAQAELDRQSSESIMQLVDHIDDILRMWFSSPVVARNNLKHVADCLDEISQAFSEKSCKLYEYTKLDSGE